MAHDAHLLAAARELLGAGPLEPEHLARRLYGVQGAVGPWLRVLDRLLSGHKEFVRTTDGRWVLRQSPSRSPLLLAGCRTRARGGRLSELAVVSASGDPDSARRWIFDTQPRVPEGPPPVETSETEGYVRFAEIVADVLELLEGRELLVLDEALVRQISAEVERCGFPPLVNQVRVLGGDLWLHEGEKRSLERLRTDLGLAPSVADPLQGELELLQRLNDPDALPPSPARGESCDPTRLRASVSGWPERPGTYVFRDHGGNALYVGSAVNLRRRVLSYFGEQIELTRGLRGLLQRTASVEHFCFGTHLEAVLEEAALITRLRPPYNVQRKVSARPTWLRIGAEAPRNVVQVASAPRGDGALYLGPLPNKAAVDAVATVLARLWGLRRRGGSARGCDESRQRLWAMGALLRESDAFCAELRRRLHSSRGALSAREWSLLSAQVERTERAVLSGELEPVASGAADALVASYDEARSRLYLLVVRQSGPLACSRVDALDARALSRAIEGLLALPWLEDTASLTDRALTARWLHLHRNDGWVSSLEGGVEEITAQFEAAVADRLASGLQAPDMPQEDW